MPLYAVESKISKIKKRRRIEVYKERNIDSQNALA